LDRHCAANSYRRAYRAAVNDERNLMRLRRLVSCITNEANGLYRDTLSGHLTSRLPSDPIVAGQMLATRKWWADASDRYELFTSDIVIYEASQG
jgi:hypothetical protein